MEIKMKTARVSFAVESDFATGDCYDCPLYAVLGEGMYEDIEMACQLGYRYDKCPITFAGERDRDA